MPQGGVTLQCPQGYNTSPRTPGGKHTRLVRYRRAYNRPTLVQGDSDQTKKKEKKKEKKEKEKEKKKKKKKKKKN